MAKLASVGVTAPSAGMAILSIQSQVLNGSVGNAAAGFIYARLGFEVWPLPTTLLSHHPGHGGAEGGPVAAPLLGALVAGLARRGAFARCEAVVSGYLAAEAAVPVVCDAVARARAAHSDTVYACDPVIGDAGRIYVAAGLVAAFRDRLLLLADIALPNPSELTWLTGRALPDRASAFAAMAQLGPKIVVLKGFRGADTPPGMLDVLVLNGDEEDVVCVRRIDHAFSGAGDAFAAFFMAQFLRNRNAGAAMRSACAASASLLDATLQMAGGDGAAELAVVQAQDDWVRAAGDPGRSGGLF